MALFGWLTPAVNLLLFLRFWGADIDRKGGDHKTTFAVDIVLSTFLVTRAGPLFRSKRPPAATRKGDHAD